MTVTTTTATSTALPVEEFIADLVPDSASGQTAVTAAVRASGCALIGQPTGKLLERLLPAA